MDQWTAIRVDRVGVDGSSVRQPRRLRAEVLRLATVSFVFGGRVHRPVIALGLALALGLTGSVAMASTESSHIASDPAVGPACPGAGAAHTPDVAVQGRTVAATWTIGEDAGIGLALSRDGGRSWSRSAVPFTTCTGGPLEFALDPDLALGADGTPWLSASGNLPPAGLVSTSTADQEGRVLVAVGDRAPVSVFPGVTTQRGFLETDPTDPDRGWVLSETLTSAAVAVGPDALPVFVPGGPEGSLLLARTDDGGRTWSRSTLRSPSPGTGVLALGLVRTGSALVALSVEFDLKDPLAVASIARNGIPRAPIAAQTSTDGGATWSAPVTLGVVEQSTLVDAAAGDGLVAVAAPQFDGTLLVWTSEDAGRTWRQTTATSGVAQPATGVAVDRRGRVAVLSYAVAGTSLTPQLSTSRDRGQTFSPPVALASSFDGAAVNSGSHVAPFGPYNGADADGGDVLVAFVADDDRDGTTEARVARVR